MHISKEISNLRENIKEKKSNWEKSFYEVLMNSDKW